jgi:hypothetical protein
MELESTSFGGAPSMRRSNWTPSIVPVGADENVYLAEDCFGRNGCVWREADSKATDLETVIADLMSGQYHDPRRVIAFNTAERWSGDVSGDVAREIQRRADLAAEDVSSTIEAFVQRYAGPNRQMSLRLA